MYALKKLPITGYIRVQANSLECATHKFRARSKAKEQLKKLLEENVECGMQLTLAELLLLL